jgi:hypothetical protein
MALLVDQYQTVSRTIAHDGFFVPNPYRFFFSIMITGSTNQAQEHLIAVLNDRVAQAEQGSRVK